MRKYLPHVLALSFFLCASGLFLLVIQLKGKLQEADVAMQTQQAQLTGQKDEIQKANARLGIAEATAVSKDALEKQYQEDIKSLGLEIADLRTKVKAKPVSKDRGTIVIEKIVYGGTQSTDPQKGAIAYNWEDPTGRFRLKDPDIAASGDETFSYRLKVRITGYIFEDSTGIIKARQVVAQELIERRNPDGTTTTIVGDRLPIEDNIYQYSVPVKKPHLFDIIKPRVFALFDTSLNPGLGVELANLGNYFDYLNIGAGLFVSVETNDFPNALHSSSLGIGVQYTVIPPFLSTNIGIGVGVATPADDLFGRFIVTGNIIFYLTN